jgi:hypothetical protein
VVNYRNEPIGLRVYDPATKAQTAGDPGDLSHALESRTDRAIAELNVQPDFYPPLTRDISRGDPYTPLLRAYMGDKVWLRTQVGATEEEHNPTVQGGQVAARTDEPELGPGSPSEVDHLYTMGAQTEDMWNGDWGILRAYVKARADLLKLPNNPIPNGGWTITNQSQFDETCPVTAPVRNYSVTALRANSGDCIKVQLLNALPPTIPDIPGVNMLPMIVHKDVNVDGAGGISSSTRTTSGRRAPWACTRSSSPSASAATTGSASAAARSASSLLPTAGTPTPGTPATSTWSR